jgi:hypothetical protein
MAKSPAIRRWQIRRMLKFIDKSKEKGRRLPPEYAEMARFLAKVPKAQRGEALEKAMEANQEGMLTTSRDFRRQAAAQQRRSGQGGGRYRPGMPPGTIQQARQQSRQQTRRKSR